MTFEVRAVLIADYHLWSSGTGSNEEINLASNLFTKNVTP